MWAFYHSRYALLVWHDRFYPREKHVHVFCLAALPPFAPSSAFVALFSPRPSHVQPLLTCTYHNVKAHLAVIRLAAGMAYYSRRGCVQAAQLGVDPGWPQPGGGEASSRASQALALF